MFITKKGEIMKLRTLKLLLPLLSVSLFAESDVVAAAERPATVESAPKCEIESYHNQITFFGNSGLYSRTKDDSLYGAVLTSTSPVLNHFQNEIIGDAELRFGYNFKLNENDKVTAFAGVGSYFFIATESFYKLNDAEYKGATPYGSVGGMYLHTFNRLFAMGANAKVLGGYSIDWNDFENAKASFGLEISSPIVFNFGNHRHWSFSLEPFYLMLKSKDPVQNYFGLKYAVGYRF
jgi:hypothetical protein